MKVERTRLEGAILIEPTVHRDDRGLFYEQWSVDRYREAGIGETFVQDNVSLSRRGVLRGLHYQIPHAQGKLVSVLQGAVWDAIVDLRRESPTFGEWLGVELSAENRRQLWVPAGFAHGFIVLGDSAIFSYKCTDRYHPECENGIRWDDPSIGIRWPVAKPIVSAKDAALPTLDRMPTERLFGPVEADWR